MDDKLNQDWILFHLEESQEAIEKMIAEIKADPEYGYGNYLVDMGHLYHHLNTAWNSRNATDDQTAEKGNSNFNKWGEFPTDLPVMKI